VAFIASQVLFETAEYEMRFVKRGVYMRNKASLIITALIIILLFAICTGCGNYLREKQLENIAKDWCMVIRASQVIPVYPLTEDLQPGDVLLVRTPIDEQVKEYKEQGFLPLDQLYARLFASDLLELSDPKNRSHYLNFYNARYETSDGVIPPGTWQTKKDAQGNLLWSMAPKAAFPNYSFTIKAGAGLDLSIPIKGIPFALKAMKADEAFGTVTISKTSTFGLDVWRLEKMVRDWALEHRKLIRNYEPHDDQQYFLRVVSRVYVTGELIVTITSDESMGAEATGGAAPPPTATETGETEEMEKDKKEQPDIVESVKEVVEDEIPGVRIIASATSNRTIGFREEIARPLVIGYLGFDMPILKGGRLGPPVSTLEQLNGKSSQPIFTTISSSSNKEAAIALLYDDFEELKGPEAARIKKKLDKYIDILPDNYEFNVYGQDESLNLYIDPEKKYGTKIEKNNFEDVLDYWHEAGDTVDKLMNNPQVTTNPEYRRDLEAAESVVRYIEYHLRNEPALKEAIDLILYEN
jgi:hypothetical protein